MIVIVLISSWPSSMTNNSPQFWASKMTVKVLVLSSGASNMVKIVLRALVTACLVCSFWRVVWWILSNVCNEET